MKSRQEIINHYVIFKYTYIIHIHLNIHTGFRSRPDSGSRDFKGLLRLQGFYKTAPAPAECYH